MGTVFEIVVIITRHVIT